MKDVVCHKGPDGLDYINTHIVIGENDHVCKALVKTGSEVSVFSAKKLGIDTEGLPRRMVSIGMEEIEVYEARIDGFYIGGDEIPYEHYILVSERDCFDETAVFGMDYLSCMKLHHEENGQTSLEFDPETIFDEKKRIQRELYIKNNSRDMSVNISDWFYIEDGMYPDDFEMVLVIMKDGSVAAGNVNTASSYLKDHPHGIIRQDRGGVIDYDSILCWSPLDNIKAF